MRLTVQSDYALRMLMFLAINDTRLCTIAEVAKRYDISKNHLMKIAQTLSHQGVIESVRGRIGGLRLARRADKISLGEVIRPLESGSPLVECFPGGGGACAITPACRLKGVLSTALEAFFVELDNCYLSDLVGENKGLYRLLEDTR